MAATRHDGCSIRDGLACLQQLRQGVEVVSLNVAVGYTQPCGRESNLLSLITHFFWAQTEEERSCLRTWRQRCTRC